jgi:hypothetical protein
MAISAKNTPFLQVIDITYDMNSTQFFEMIFL